MMFRRYYAAQMVAECLTVVPAGEELYPLVMDIEADLAGKITGMLLEMSEADVISIIEDHSACQDKVGIYGTAPTSCRAARSCKCCCW